MVDVTIDMLTAVSIEDLAGIIVTVIVDVVTGGIVDIVPAVVDVVILIGVNANALIAPITGLDVVSTT